MTTRGYSHGPRDILIKKLERQAEEIEGLTNGYEWERAKRRQMMGNLLDLQDELKEARRPCTCGSGAHPRKCEKHPLAYDHHISQLNYETKLEDENEALRKVAEAARAIRCEAIRNYTKGERRLSCGRYNCRCGAVKLGDALAALTTTLLNQTDPPDPEAG